MHFHYSVCQAMCLHRRGYKAGAGRSPPPWSSEGRAPIWLNNCLKTRLKYIKITLKVERGAKGWAKQIYQTLTFCPPPWKKPVSAPVSPRIAVGKTLKKFSTSAAAKDG